MLHCDRFQIQTMVEQAQEAYPKECCGLLLGQKQGNDRYCHKIWPTANAWTMEIAQEFGLEGLGSVTTNLQDRIQDKIQERIQGSTQVTAQGSAQHSQNDRYWINPQDVLTAQKWGRDQGHIIIGIYHSHPDYPAIPSERDRHWAWAEYVYLILSIQCNQLLDYQCWQLNDSRQFEPEGLLVPAL